MSAHERVKLGHEQLDAVQIVGSPTPQPLGSFRGTRVDNIHMRPCSTEVAVHLFEDEIEGSVD